MSAKLPPVAFANAKIPTRGGGLFRSPRIIRVFVAEESQFCGKAVDTKRGVRENRSQGKGSRRRRE